MEKINERQKINIAVVQQTQRLAEKIASDITHFMQQKGLECFDVQLFEGRELFLKNATRQATFFDFDILVTDWPSSKRVGDNFLSKVQGVFPDALCVVLNLEDFSFVPENLPNLAGFGNLSIPGEFFRVMDRAIGLLPGQQEREKEMVYG